MKIVQIFNREKIEYERFKEINNKHRNAWVRTVWYNSIFFPIAEMAFRAVRLHDKRGQRQCSLEPEYTGLGGHR